MPFTEHYLSDVAWAPNGDRIMGIVNPGTFQQVPRREIRMFDVAELVSAP